MRIRYVASLVAAACLSSETIASAQTPRVPPDTSFILQEEKVVDRFVVQRWVSEANSIYSIERGQPRALLSLNSDDCAGELVDLDGNGTAEFKNMRSDVRL